MGAHQIQSRIQCECNVIISLALTLHCRNFTSRFVTQNINRLTNWIFFCFCLIVLYIFLFLHSFFDLNCCCFDLQFQVNDNEFILSFVHKPQTDITTKFYYAFTFPFTYTDCQNQLARFDTLYQKSNEDINYILRRLNADGGDVDVNCNTINCESHDSGSSENVQKHLNGTSYSLIHILCFVFKTHIVLALSQLVFICRCINSNRFYVCLFRFLVMETNRESTSPHINRMENHSNMEIENDIYYHRELLINSVEDRRIDLLTISSFHNIQKAPEYQFPELFPDPHSERCKTFKNKKVQQQ